MANRLFVALLLSVLSLHSFSQKKWEIDCEGNTNLTTSLLKHFKKTETQPEMSSILIECYNQGYLEAEVSMDTSKADVTVFHVLSGEQYQWDKIALKKEALPLNIYRYNPDFLSQKPLSPNEFSTYLSEFLHYLENSGYPFASLALDSVLINESSVSAKLDVQLGPEIQIDSVKLIGNAKISNRYISNYIRIKPGDLYNEQRLREIPQRIDELPFVSQPAPAEVIFNEEHTSLVIALQKEKANDFNGIIGFQPDANTQELVITGDVHLKLVSPLGKGERIQLRWRRLQTQTQDIQVQLNAPYLLNSPIGADANFQIYRRDTTFSTITARAGLQYALNGGDYFEVNVTSETSNLISTEPFESSATLPEVADVSFLHYGTTFQSSRLDYRLNPRKGYFAKISGSVGEKRIRENPALENVDYDSIDLVTTQFKASVDAGVFIPVIKRGAIHYRLQGGLLNNESLFRNELYRLGGLRSIRGFDEESIFASTYVIQSLETRFILEKNAYTYLFFDIAYYEDVSQASPVSDWPYGFGGGVSFQTGAGIFSVNYALGSQFNQGVDIRSGKIHFGFVSFF